MQGPEGRPTTSCEGRGTIVTMGWRTKFVFLLIVYSSGFATAVYCLGPTPEQDSGSPVQVADVRSALKSEELARSVNSGMHKCIAFGKETAFEAARLLREKIDEAQSPSDG